jgi:hypothetical protein
MCFLIMDIGSEDILLGYPWLASFEPKFSWRHAVIDERISRLSSHLLTLASSDSAGNRSNPIRRRKATHSPHTRISVNYSRSIHGTSNSGGSKSGRWLKSQKYTNDLPSYSAAKHRPDSHHLDHGITLSISNQQLPMHYLAKSTL